MKVGMVVPRYPPSIGGVEWHARMIATGLVQAGVSVEVLTAEPGLRAPTNDQLDGVRVRRFPTLASDATFLVAPRLAAWLLRHAGSWDLVHAHSYHTPMPVLAGLAARRRRTPLVITPHYHGTGHTRARALLHVPYRPAGAWALRQAEAIISVSAAERSSLKGAFGGLPPLMPVIPNGVDVDRIRAAPPHAHRDGLATILAVGRLETYKGVARVVQACARLPAVQLVIVGDGPDRERISSLVDQSGSGERVRMLSGLPRDELLSWFRTADVVVSMSEHEAFGLTLLEGAAGGARVVASDIPAHREVATMVPSGVVELVALEGSTDELAGAIRAAVGRGRSVDVAPGIPTWEAAARATLDLYHQVLRTPPDHT